MTSTVAFAIAAIGAFGVAFSVNAAPSGLYSGRFPVAVTETGRPPFNGCLVLTDNGQNGFPHSGPAMLEADQSGGAFQIIGRLLVVSIEVPTGTGEIDYLVLAAPAKSGVFGVGVFDNPGLFTGKATFGSRGGC